ncbi:hypothetical protein GCM10020221_24690 [Streptomyces thioluteus]|uniref:Uncharacterized protein n=1 Tax=Streptomyces thioluteus TaxID=66431 RepID=A0ABP6JDT2_STRTU
MGAGVTLLGAVLGMDRVRPTNIEGDAGGDRAGLGRADRDREFPAGARSNAKRRDEEGRGGEHPAARVRSGPQPPREYYQVHGRTTRTYMPYPLSIKPDDAEQRTPHSSVRRAGVTPGAETRR